MSPTVTSIDRIDLDIAVAYVALGAARTSWAHSPSAANQRLVDEAEAALDRLLDERLAVRPEGQSDLVAVPGTA